MTQSRTALLLLGLIAGAVVGYVTRPAAAEIRLGGASLEVQDLDRTASPDAGLTAGQGRRIMIFTVGGGILGLVAGLALDRR